MSRSNLKDVAHYVHRDHPTVSRGVIESILSDAFQVILEFAAIGDQVKISKFGTFKASYFKGRTLVTPLMEGGSIEFKDQLVLRFKQASKAKQIVNTVGRKANRIETEEGEETAVEVGVEVEEAKGIDLEETSEKKLKTKVVKRKKTKVKAEKKAKTKASKKEVTGTKKSAKSRVKKKASKQNGDDNGEEITEVVESNEPTISLEEQMLTETDDGSTFQNSL
jgi:nucleoid DNA-binding protein